MNIYFTCIYINVVYVNGFFLEQGTTLDFVTTTKMLINIEKTVIISRKIMKTIKETIYHTKHSGKALLLKSYQ